MTTDAVGGVWRYTVDLAACLTRRGVPVTVAVLGPATSAAQRCEAARARVTLVDTGLPLDWTAASPTELDRSIAQLRAHTEHSDIDSVHCHAAALVGATPWRVRVVSVAHSCMATWWRAVRGDEMPPDFAWRAHATQVGMRASDVVVAPTRAHADALRACYGPMLVNVVYNGIASSERIDCARERAVLAAGRLWDEAKGMAALDAAAACLDAPIYAAGSTRGPNGAAAQLPRLHLLGELAADNMAAAYRRLAVFVSLSQYEPFGLSVLEAARAGMRLVLADIATFRELWDGVARFVTPGSDPVCALRAALADTGDGGAADRSNRYDIEHTARQILALHRPVAAQA